MSDTAEEDFCKNANHTWMGALCKDCAKPVPTVVQTLYWAAARIAGLDQQLSRSRAEIGRLRSRLALLEGALRYAWDALNTHGGPPLHSGCVSGNPCKRCAFDKITSALSAPPPAKKGTCKECFGKREVYHRVKGEPCCLQPCPACSPADGEKRKEGA